MVGYESLRNLLGAKLDPGIAPLLAGASARVLSATVVSPIELVRTRLQASHAPPFEVVLRNIRGTVRSRGILTLWKGLPPTLFRDVPFSGIYWASYEALKFRLLRLSTAPPTDKTRLSISFISGAVSGTVRPILICIHNF